MLYSFIKGLGQLDVVPIINESNFNTLQCLFGHRQEMQNAYNDAGFYVNKIVISNHCNNGCVVELIGDESYGLTAIVTNKVPSYKNNTKFDDNFVINAFINCHSDIECEEIVIKNNKSILRLYDGEKYITGEFISSVKKNMFVKGLVYYGIDPLTTPISYIPDYFFNEVKDWSLRGLKYYLAIWSADWQISMHYDSNDDWCARATRWYPDGINGHVGNSIYGVIVAPRYEIAKIHDYLWKNTDIMSAIPYMSNKELTNLKNKILAE